jgi:hypothetical protein
MARLLGALVLVFCTASPVMAQTEAHDMEARALFEAGRVAFVDERFDDALGYFRRAHELSRRPELLYNIATTLDRLDRDDEALTQYQAFLAAVPDAGNRGDVELRIAALRRRAEAATAERAAAAAAAGERAEAERAAAAAEREAAAAERDTSALTPITPDFDEGAAERTDLTSRPAEGRTIRAGEEADVPPASGGGDVTSEAWFWVVIGAVVVGAGVGITVGVLASQDPGETAYIPGETGVIMTLTGSF